MRKAFVNTLMEIANKNKDVVLITGDLGFSVFEDFIKQFPNQYLNAGVAEQNMTGVASGMALTGKIPLIYSIIPFVTMRNYEQVRNDICYQNLNVKIVGVGAGFSYGTYGPTHCSIDDISILRTLPNMTIYSPADSKETEEAVRQAFKIEGPAYIRLAKTDEEVITDTLPKPKDFKAAILAHSLAVKEAAQVARELTKIGVIAAAFSVFKVWPIERQFILDLAKKAKIIATIEEHLKTGGLGSIFAEILAESKEKVVFKRFGIDTLDPNLIGTRDYLMARYGLSVDNIVKTISENK